MPRNTRAALLLPLGLSVQAAADSLMVRPEEIRALECPTYQVGMRRRVLVSDLIDAIRKRWRREKVEKRLRHVDAATNPANEKRSRRARKGSRGGRAPSPHAQAEVRAD